MKRFVVLAAIFGLSIGLYTSVARADAPDLSSPKAAAMAFAKAMQVGDAAAAKSATLSDAENQEIVGLLAGMVSSNLKLRDAAKAKWGEDAGDQLAGNMKNLDMAKQLEKAEVKEEGDTATITSPEGGNPVKLKKVDGTWHIDMVNSMAGQAGSAQQLSILKAIGSTMSDLAGEIAEGKYKTVEEAKSALQTKVLGAMASVRRPTTAPATAPGK